MENAWITQLHRIQNRDLYTYYDIQVILPTAPGVSNEGRSSPLLVLVPPFLGPGFRLGARWNRLGVTVKTRKKRGKTGEKWARCGLKRVNKEMTGGITWFVEALSGPG